MEGLSHSRIRKKWHHVWEKDEFNEPIAGASGSRGSMRVSSMAGGREGGKMG